MKTLLEISNEAKNRELKIIQILCVVLAILSVVLIALDPWDVAYEISKLSLRSHKAENAEAINNCLEEGHFEDAYYLMYSLYIDDDAYDSLSFLLASYANVKADLQRGFEMISDETDDPLDDLRLFYSLYDYVEHSGRLSPYYSLIRQDLEQRIVALSDLTYEDLEKIEESAYE